MYESAKNIVKKLQQNNFCAYFVGGWVRNKLLGRPSKDIDIATDATPEEIKKIFNHYHEVGVSFGVVNVIAHSGDCFEVATLREEDEYLDGRHPEEIRYTNDIKKDAMRRDFTVNAMFFDPISEQYFDFYNGMNDLKRGVLNTVGDPMNRFSEDALRILRAVRFAVEYNLTIEQQVIEAIISLKNRLNMLSVERIREELNKMLLGKNPERAFRLLAEYQLLEVILPEVDVLRGIEQNPIYHPEGDVFEHTMLMLRHFTLKNHDLAWSILLHDVGKKTTQEFTDEGNVHFYCHEVDSAEIAQKILERLKFSKQSSKIIIKAVGDHMRYAHVDKMRKAKWRRILDYEYFPLELELHRIDCLSSNRLMGNYNLLLQRYRECDENDEVKISPFLGGKDLIALGFKPGKIFKDILNKVTEMQLEEVVKSKEDALDYVRKNFLEKLGN